MRDPDSGKQVSWRAVTTSVICGIALWIHAIPGAPIAHADDLVTYEVVSDVIPVANIEYEDANGRVVNDGVALPWRADVTVRSVHGAPPEGSQVRADWRPSAGPMRWLTVRIIYQGKIICQNTLDVGDATCYGITPHLS
jgi:hypothetical protein